MKKKLVYFQPYITPYRIDLFNDLNEAFDLKVFLTLPNSEGQAFGQQELESQLHFSTQYLPTGSVIQCLRTLRREIRSFNPDIILTYEYGLITVAILLWRWLTRSRVRIVGMSDDSYDMLNGNDFTLRHRFARKHVAQYLDDIVLVEPKVVDWYQRSFGLGFLFPIIRDERVVARIYNDAAPLMNEFVARYNLSSSHIFLFVGRLVPVKNLPALIQAFGRFNQSDNILVIVGDGPEKERLQQLSFDQGLNVLFVGQQKGPALNVWYLLADTFVLPSLKEPFGAVTNEALIGGCNAVVSERAGSKCLIQDGVNGFVFDPDREDDLLEKMRMCKRLSESGKSRRFPRSSKMALDYESLFRKLLGVLDPERSQE